MDFFGSLLDPFIAFVQHAIEMIHGILAKGGLESYGLSIIILTVIIKMALYPLTVKQIRSMKAMQELQPKMKKLQEQYKSNPQRLQEETMRLYGESGVNPLAGCLPLLVQMPILMAIYYALKDMNYVGDPSFLWMQSLTEPDPLHVLPVLSAATTYVVSKQTSPDGSNSQMKMMTFLMPVFIGWISWNFAAGLVVYWIMMNAVQGAQQWWMFRGETDRKPSAATKKKKRKEKEDA